MASVAHGERGVRRQFLRELHARHFVQARAAVLFRHASAEQADFSGFLEQLRQQARLVLFEIGNEGNYFVADKLLGGLADEFLIVG